MPTTAVSGSALRRLLLPVLLAAVLACAAPAMAADGDPEPPPTAPSWVTAFYKALSYEAITGYINMGSLSARPPYWMTRGYFGADAATGIATFYAHELIWSALGPAPGSESVAAVGLGKAITFRAVDMARAFALTLAFTGDPMTAAGIATASVVVDTSVYLLNEYGWTLFGPQPPGTPAPPPLPVARR
ncbi:DUF2061 domain-containing protein [Azospirillum halopraeferens]|uniref:DUF2061 domain-containing protein n=1 Tax=Azospirillum halopraeferens TaxID=34010 RepID=UPI0003F768B8|nr:DUF2061 domain-containing protein [Azospirillum halopraeferens]